MQNILLEATRQMDAAAAYAIGFDPAANQWRCFVHVENGKAGAPPFQLWVLPRRLPRDVLVGTWAVYFATLNWIKVPAFFALGQFTRTNMLTAAVLLPLAVVSTFAGVWLVRRIDGERFYTIIYWLMILVGIILIVEAATA